MKALTVRRTTTASAQEVWDVIADGFTYACLLYTSPSPRD